MLKICSFDIYDFLEHETRNPNEFLAFMFISCQSVFIKGLDIKRGWSVGSLGFLLDFVQQHTPIETMAMRIKSSAETIAVLIGVINFLGTQTPVE